MTPVGALLGASLLLLPVWRASGEMRGAERLEDKVKTAFLYKFTKYIRWPDSPPAEEFRIVVLGDTRILGPLRELAAERLVEGRKIRVSHPESGHDIGPCRILLIGRAERERLPDIVRKTEGRGILTVGDGEGFAARGAVVGFVVVNGRVRFEVNRRAAERAGLEISSELLKLAILTEPEAGDGPR